MYKKLPGRIYSGEAGQDVEVDRGDPQPKVGTQKVRFFIFIFILDILLLKV